MEASTYGIISLIPAVLAVLLAFITRNAIFSLALACLIGVLIAGQGLMGFPALLINAMGNGDFVWVLLIEVFIGILVAFFQRTGATDSFSEMLGKKTLTRRRTQLTGWLLGIFIFFSDYFSPLFVGPVMRNLTDKAKISREKLAYICDSTSAPVCTIIPFTAWSVYIAGLLVGMGNISDNAVATNYFIKSVPFNFYGLFAVALVGLIAAGIVPDFGPMKRAEERAMNEGLVIAEGATPMMGEELTSIKPNEKIKPSIFLNFILPVLIIIVVAISTFMLMGSAKTLEAFILAVVVLGVTMKVQGISDLQDITETAIKGIKGVMPAVIILGLAYAINSISKQLGTASYVISITQNWLTPALLVFLTFVTSSIISFFTGTSWGTYAIMMPISVPLAFAFTGGSAGTVVYATIAAVTGGGLFGDHCSPLSDTTILSSLGSASDHIDHVKTQLPYALVAAGLACVLYLAVGVMS